MNRKTLTIMALVAAMAAAPAFAERVIFRPLGEDFIATDTTADGSQATALVIGGVGTWNETDGAVKIGNGCSGGQLKMSSDGSTIVGNERAADGKCEAARYDGTPGAWTTMGTAPGGLACGSGRSSSYDTNNDTAVGLFWTANLCRAIGGTWDVPAGIAGPELTSTVPNRPTRGNAITDDGSIVAGWQDAQTGFRQAARWVNGVQELITDDNGTVVGEVIAMNSTGTVMAGTGWQGDVGGTGQGWLWREGEGMIPMGVGGLGRNIQSVPIAVSEDGKTVVGLSRDFDNFIQIGWIWTEKGGWEQVEDFVKGGDAKGYTFLSATAVSADGSRIFGHSVGPNGFEAYIIDRGSKGPQK
jgi:hypothetical protein